MKLKRFTWLSVAVLLVLLSCVACNKNVPPPPPPPPPAPTASPTPILPGNSIGTASPHNSATSHETGLGDSAHPFGLVLHSFA